MTPQQRADRAATLIKTQDRLGEDFDACFSDDRKQVEALLVEMAGNDPTLLANMRWHTMLHLVSRVYAQH